MARWRKKTSDGIARENIRMTGPGRFEILGLVEITTPGPWWWQTQDLNEPTTKGAIFRCYEEGNDHELAYLLVADISDNRDEPNIERLKPKHVAGLDRALELEARK